MVVENEVLTKYERPMVPKELQLRALKNDLFHLSILICDGQLVAHQIWWLTTPTSTANDDATGKCSQVTT